MVVVVFVVVVVMEFNFVVVISMFINMGCVVDWCMACCLVAVMGMVLLYVMNSNINMGVIAVAEIGEALVDFMSSTWGKEACSFTVVVASVSVNN